MNADDVRQRLDSIAEDLADMALDALRERDGDRERRITRARRAVEKASHLLEFIETGEADDTDGDH